jgi:Bacterial Ig-like domain (group 2).
MKKFLIGVIFLIPVVVLLSLTATGRIIRTTAPVNANNISVRDRFNQEIDPTVPIRMDVGETAEFIIAELLPTITNQSIIYENDDLPGAGAIKLEKINGTNRYLIVPEKSGVARVILRAENNRNVYKVITVYIREAAIKEVVFYTGDGTVVDSGLKVYGKTRVFADIIPNEALSGASVEWTSEDENVAKVSKNGSVTPVAPGKTHITLSCLDTSGNKFTASLAVDTTKALVNANVLYSSGEADAEFVFQNAVVNKRATVEEIEKGKFRILYEGLTADVEIIEAEEGEWELEEIPAVLFTNNGPFFLSALIKESGEKISPAYSVDKPEILKIKDGALTPLKRGAAVLTASFEGKTKKYTIEARERPTYFTLKLNKEDYETGIKMARNWGLNWFIGEGLELTNLFRFGCSLEDGQGDVLWESDNTGYAAIDENALIFFKPAAAGNSVKITASIMVGNYRSKLTRSFTFNFVSDPEAINIYGTAEFRKAYNSDPYRTFVLQGNMNSGADYDWTIYIRNDFYGNGFMIDAKGMEMNRYTDVLKLNGEDSLPAGKNSYLIEDVVIEGAKDYESAAERGEAINVYHMTAPVTLRYVVARYLNNSISIDNSTDVTVEGCILGDSYFSAIAYLSYPGVDRKLTLKNSVFKPTVGPSIIATNNFVRPEYFNKQYFPTTRIEGFLDIYNWKTSEEIKGILSPMDPGTLGEIGGFLDPSKVYESIGKAIKTIFERPEIASQAYVEEGKRYFCVGMLALGLYSVVDPAKIYLGDPGLKTFTFTLPTDNTDTGLLVSIFEAAIKLINPEMTLLHPNCVLTYRTDGNGPRNKPRDPVPETKELYQRLGNRG